VHPVTRHALGDNCPTESFYEAPELCHLILKWHAQKSKMIVGPCKFEHRMVAVDPAGVERCKVLNLASRIAASWYTSRRTSYLLPLLRSCFHLMFAFLLKKK